MKRVPMAVALLSAAMLILGAACSADDDDGQAGTSSTSAAVTLPTSPTSAGGQEPTTETTQKPTSSSTATTAGSTSSSSTSSSSPTTGSSQPKAEGSGCSPGDGALPDGRWYGTVETTDDDSFDFDLACYFTGQDAAIAAAEDGEESPPPNDYYIRNTNKTVRTLQVDPPADVIWYPDAGDPGSETTTDYADWVEAVSDRGLVLGVWVKIDDGLVTAIEEQWVP